MKFYIKFIPIVTCLLLAWFAFFKLGSSGNELALDTIRRSTPLVILLPVEVSILENTDLRFVAQLQYGKQVNYKDIVKHNYLLPLEIEKKSLYFQSKYYEIPSWNFSSDDEIWVASGSHGTARWETAFDQKAMLQKVLIRYDW